MANRQPISTNDILDKSQHAGKNLVGNLMSTANDPNLGFGFNTGNFYGFVQAAGSSTTVIPEYSIQVIDVYAISAGANVAAEELVVEKVDSSGTATPLFKVAFTGTALQLVRTSVIATPSVYADLTVAQGYSLRIRTAGGVTGGAYVFVSFRNV